MKKIYFASDFHLGVPDYARSLEREKRVVSWLDEISADASDIYLMGDLFDFWFEYRSVVPKGFVRILGKIAELSDRGIRMHLFTGNHDMWTFGYLEKELNCKLYRKPIRVDMNGKKFLLGHGDGLGPGDYGYKFIKKIFRSSLCQWLFARLHPNLGMGMGLFWSRRSRIATGTTEEKFLGEENEWLLLYAKEQLKKEHVDYFIFGHRHLPLDIKLSDTSRYINLGDWLRSNTYAVFDGENLELKYFTR